MSAWLRVALGAAALAFAGLQWLRWPEPLGLDQSLFALYGRWLARGLTLYRDLWDSKPPGVFMLYAAANAAAGAVHSAWILDLLLAVATSLLAARLAFRLAAGADREADSHLAAVVAAIAAAFIWSAPAFGGPQVSGQAESCMAPLLLGAALSARRPSRRAALGCGLLLGAAATLKLVALFALPIAWLFAPAGTRRDGRRNAAVAAGFLLPLGFVSAALAVRGTFAEALQAVCVYPRHYQAEILERTALPALFSRGALRLGRGVPLLVLLATAGAIGTFARRSGRPVVAWLALAAIAVLVQLQMAGYHLLFLAPPLCVLAGLGAPHARSFVVATWWRAQRGQPPALAALVAVSVVLAAAVATDARRWVRHYTPHLAHRTGRIDHATFLSRLGGPGPLWAESEEVAAAVRAEPAGGDAMLVWGLAPSVYLLADARPATRYAFHQTFFVPEAPLAVRWPDAGARRNALLASLQREPPRWVVIVHGDRSGLEPVDSATELERFPPLAEWLASRYRQHLRTPAYRLLLRNGAD